MIQVRIMNPGCPEELREFASDWEISNTLALKGLPFSSRRRMAPVCACPPGFP